MDDLSTKIYQKNQRFLSYYLGQKILSSCSSSKFMDRHVMVEFLHTFSKLRHKYWVPQRQATIKSILRRCLKCICYQVCQHKVKAVTLWPKCKVAMSSPFLNTGIDYFWPLYTKIGTNQKIVWACLFTCIAGCTFWVSERHVCRALSWRTRKIHNTKK